VLFDVSGTLLRNLNEGAKTEPPNEILKGEVSKTTQMTNTNESANRLAIQTREAWGRPPQLTVEMSTVRSRCTAHARPAATSFTSHLIYLLVVSQQKVAKIASQMQKKWRGVIPVGAPTDLRSSWFVCSNGRNRMLSAWHVVNPNLLRRTPLR
jgi:hypothetical protein